MKHEETEFTDVFLAITLIAVYTRLILPRASQYELYDYTMSIQSLSFCWDKLNINSSAVQLKCCVVQGGPGGAHEDSSA